MIVPIWSLTEEEQKKYHLEAVRNFRRIAAEKLRLPEEDVIIRPVVIGDPTVANVEDFYDLRAKTAVATGQEWWGQDSSDITANQLSSILYSGESVPDEKLVAVYGFVDLTPNPDLYMLRFKRGEEVKDVWQVEHCYAKEPFGGINVDDHGRVRLIVWYPKDPIDWQMAFKSSSDKRVVLYALVAESKGKVITTKQL